MRRVAPFTDLGRQDASRVEGGNALLGELIDRLGAAGNQVPPGFATTADAYGELLDAHRLRSLLAAHVLLHRRDPAR
ncbi:hypothetical protein AB0G79_31280 [Streptomyces sp. NPDC020807]|uniref:hypothetical protein n=1 Tax=Streptomyces sp. NPDC020807 TaxID=3155119 RepID=UPI0033F735D4